MWVNCGSSYIANDAGMCNVKAFIRMQNQFTLKFQRSYRCDQLVLINRKMQGGSVWCSPSAHERTPHERLHGRGTALNTSSLHLPIDEHHLVVEPLLKLKSLRMCGDLC